MNVCGILGGTFDPVHLGHVALAAAALRELPLVEVLWLPSGNPGHRAQPIAGAEQRLAMLGLAIAGNPRFRVDATELASRQPTYTVPSLMRLRAQFGADRSLVLLLGADSFLSLPTWLRWRELFDLAHIAIADRPGHKPELGAMAPELAREVAPRLAPVESLRESAAGALVRFDMPQLDISSSAIRSAIAAGHSAQHLLPRAVLAYIEKHHLYRKETRNP